MEEYITDGFYFVGKSGDFRDFKRVPRKESEEGAILYGSVLNLYYFE